MPHRIRKVTDAQCQTLLEDLEALRMEFDRFLSKHQGLVASIWLGGDRDADNTEKGPADLVAAFDQLRKARALLTEADHQVAMFRVTGASD